MEPPNPPVNAPQCYCPWCGGDLTADAREAANRMRDEMEESASRWRASLLVVKEAGKPVCHQAKAKRSALIVLRAEGALDCQPLARNSPNPIEADDDQAE
jgi:hypothetical protein